MPIIVPIISRGWGLFADSMGGAGYYSCVCAAGRWLEQDPTELLESVRACIGGVVNSLNSENTPISSIYGIGITNQRETTILWDRLTGIPFYNAIGMCGCGLWEGLIVCCFIYSLE